MTESIYKTAYLGLAIPLSDVILPRDWTLWDVHTVPKRATIKLQLATDKVRASKLHLSDVPIQPDSVHLLSVFPASKGLDTIS